MPSSHRRHAEWTPTRLLREAEAIGPSTIADAVLDRLVHGAHHLELKGESMRKLRAAKAKLDETTG